MTATFSCLVDRVRGQEFDRDHTGITGRLDYQLSTSRRVIRVGSIADDSHSYISLRVVYSYSSIVYIVATLSRVSVLHSIIYE